MPRQLTACRLPTRSGEKVALDFVLIGSTLVPVDMMWEQPQVRSLLGSLGNFGRGICLDRRGWGSSDALTIEATPSLDMWLDDIVAVMAAAGSERAAFWLA